MTILEAMKHSGIRLSNGKRWLVVSEDEEFTVYLRPAYSKTSKELYRGTSESIALEKLINGDESDRL